MVMLWTTVSGFESLPPSHFAHFVRSWLLGTSLGFARLTNVFAALGTNPCLPHDLQPDSAAPEFDR